MKIILIGILATLITSCAGVSQESKDRKQVEAQQSQYAAAQPVPAYDWSLERHLIIELYNMRNMRAVTHSVWRSDRGLIEGDCASIGFGIPYDTSLTNPLTATDFGRSTVYDLHVVEQAEPNGIFASKNTAATWVLCAGKTGMIEPIYVETKVTTYPYRVTVNYDKNRVTKAGEATVTIDADPS
jgi:hypothetical protein